MKIKCPFCDWEESRGDTIETHLWFEMYNGKSHSPEKIVNYLYTLYSKIHEKIESLQNRMNEIDRNGGFYFENQYQKYKEYQFELKSLLENK